VAALANSLTIVYIYATYLSSAERHEPGGVKVYSHPLLGGEGSASLGRFTFSLAMLPMLKLWTCVSIPTAAVLFALESERVCRLKQLFEAEVDASIAGGLKRMLDRYLGLIKFTFVSIMFLSVFHLERPRGHYLCAVASLGGGFCMISQYLRVLAAVARVCKCSEAVGARLRGKAKSMQGHARVATLVLALHLFLAGAAVWKVANLGDDLRALIFGVVEVAVILGYQGFMAAFAFDDIVANRAPAGGGDPH